MIQANEIAIIEAAKPSLTHSSTQCFRTCPRKYWLQYVKLLRPAHQSDALRIGSAFHLGIEVAKNGGSESDAMLEVHAAYRESPVPPWSTPEQFDVEMETSAAMVKGWCRRWAGDTIVKYVAAEQVFDLPILNPATGQATPSYRSRGKIDAIIRLPDDRWAIMEHKTASEDLGLDSDYWKRLALDSQISRYFLAARSLGYDVKTTLYDVTRKPLIRPKNIAKADRALATSEGHYFGVPLTMTCPEREDSKLYAARLVADMASRPEWYFARVEIPRLSEDLSEFEADSWTLQKQIRDCELNERRWGRSAWPRNTGACTNPYRCTYLDICRGLTGDPSEQVPEGFVQVTVAHQELL
jgi:hypothetical protein